MYIFIITQQTYNTQHNIVVCDQSTIQCALSLNQKSIALNFADGIIPGGNYRIGKTVPQEEALCAATNLYQVLTQEQCMKHYYLRNKSVNNQLQFNRCIFSKNYIIRDDKLNLLSQYQPIEIITCAAVCNYDVDQNKTDEAHNIKIQNIYTTISQNTSEDTPVILGAFGCGAFNNDPYKMALTFKNNLQYLRNKNIYFAIPNSNGINYQTFKKIFDK